MIVRIPIGRTVQWAKDMKLGYSPIPEGQTHAFLNQAGLIWKEAKPLGGPYGDPWCVHCGRNYRKHPDIDYPVFVPPAEWSQVPEASVPIGWPRASGKPVRWPFKIVSDRGRVFHLFAANEEQALEHTTAFESFYERIPVFVRLDFPVPETPGTCAECSQENMVASTEYRVWEWEAELFLTGRCGECVLRKYLDWQATPECTYCDGMGWSQSPDVFRGRPQQCFACKGSGLMRSA